jgi:hypothetical protein
MAKFYRWYNDQPVSPVALDAVPAARLLGVTPTSFCRMGEAAGLVADDGASVTPFFLRLDLLQIHGTTVFADCWT